MNEHAMRWAELGAQVESGGLYLEPGVASRCAQRCAEFVGQLDALRIVVRRLSRMDGFGTFPSGIALAEKFGQKASGGSYSMDQALADHIVEVQRMQQLFEKIEAMYGAAEDSAVQGITSVGSGLDWPR
ncbi:hypothetical protein ACWDUM_26230 [Rhodococcus sp. NPDC003322]